MSKFSLQIVFRFFIAAVWLINGLYCKVLGFVPRHQEIVAMLLSQEWAHELTLAIGVGEVMLGIWIILGKYSKLTAITQIVLVLVMNLIEFIMVPDLLLWGRMNAMFAVLFAIFIYLNEFVFIKVIRK